MLWSPVWRWSPTARLRRDQGPEPSEEDGPRRETGTDASIAATPAPERLLRIEPGAGPTSPAVAEALVVTVRSHQAAVLVVGSRGRSAVQEILLGSVAMAVLHHAYRPVMVVPPNDRP